MQAPYRIRPCSISDVPVLETLIPLSARGLQTRHYSHAQIEGALGTVFGVDTQLIKDGTYFVAESEAVIVGCGGWSFRKTMFGSDSAKQGEDLRLDPAQDPARIRAFFVHPDWARQGIGSEIMRQCERAATEAGFRRIEIVATLSGEVLYEKFGYRVIERYEVPLQNGLQLPVVKMTKETASNDERNGIA